MTVSAHQVAAALRELVPGVSAARLHRLLYYVQGHHWALRGRPAFAERVLAGPDGPYVDGRVAAPPAERAVLPESEANVVLMVVARYGRLTTADLTRLARAERPWQATELDAEITADSLRAFFTTDGAQEGADRYTPDQIARLHEEVRQARDAARDEPPAPALTLDQVLAKVVGRDDR